MPEAHLATCQIHLPHAAEAFVVEFSHLVTMCLKALVPMPQRLGIVEAENFDVCGEETTFFHRSRHLRERRNVRAGEDILANEGVDRAGLVKAADGVKHANAVVCQQLADLGEKLVVVRFTYVLEHANRNDPVIGPVFVAVIHQLEAAAILQAHLGAAFLAKLVLLDRKGNPRYVAACLLGKIEAKTTPAGANIERLQARPCQIELRCQVLLLVVLRLLKAIVEVPEVSAGILPIRIEEIIVECSGEVIVVGDVLLCLADRIELLQSPPLAKKAVDDLIKRLRL